MRRLARWLRVQWAAVIVLIVSVVVAGSLLRFDWGDQFGATYRTGVGTTIRLDDSERVVVNGVSLAGRVQQGSSIKATTSEVFLVVDYTIAVDDQPYGSIVAKLLSGSKTYASYNAAVVRPDVGFQRQRQLVFEIAVDDLAGAQLQMYTARTLREFERVVVIDLGLDGPRVAALLTQRYQTVTLVENADEVQR